MKKLFSGNTKFILKRLQNIIVLFLLLLLIFYAGSLISKRNELDITLKVEGNMDKLIKTLANYPVSSIETLHPSLEEIFLAYYKDERQEVL